MTTSVVVFDLDDTLYLERDYVRSGFESVGEWLEHHHAIAGFSATAWNEFELGRRGDIFDRALAQMGIAPGVVDVAALVDVYRRHSPSIELLPDARRALDDSATSARIGIITDGPASSQRAKLDALCVADWADHIVVTAELDGGRSKPDPAAFESVMAASGEPAIRHVYIGDNPVKDFVAPRALGWRTIRVRRDGQLHAALASGDDVDREVADLDAAMSELVAFS